VIPTLRIGNLTGQQSLGARQFRVAALGPGVERLRPDIDIRALPDPEEQRIDPVALLAAGALQGLFSGSTGVTGKITAHSQRLAHSRPDVAHWKLFLEGVDPGALRLLVAMLDGHELDFAEIVADGYAGTTSTDSTLLPYPSCTTPREFVFAYERPTKSHGARGVRLVFAYPPEDATLDLVIAALDTWANIVMAGAYSNSDPHAGAFAEQATLEEPCVVGVSLPLWSGANELMFSPVVNLARRIHALHAPLERLEIL
jgi:hypothetical protein